MSYRNTEVATVVADSKNKEDIICALCELSEFDNDFTGENGSDYLWEKAKDKGYTSNREYLSDHIKSTSYEEVVKEFLHEWLWYDSYYGSYKYNLDETKDGKVVIGLTYTH